MPHRRQQIHRSIYPLRVFGMLLGGLLISAVLHEQSADASLWGWMALTCIVWPHLAYLHTRFAPDHHRAETWNLLTDSAIAGAWVPLMHFSLLPCVVLVLVTTFDKLSTGIRRLWQRSLPGMLGAAVLLALWLRPEPLLQSSLVVVICTLPLLVMHTLAVSLASHRLIRTVSRQNKELETLRRTDQHSSLCSRDYWMKLANDALEVHRQAGSPVCVMMIDIDHFKSINDSYGHTVGDEVIRAVGLILRQFLRPHDQAGRYGGDEFAVFCPNTSLADGKEIARRICERIAALRLRESPQMCVTSSIGLAAARPSHASLREWINEADAALYEAKRAGRNQVQASG